jgi:hypothetical protein
LFRKWREKIGSCDNTWLLLPDANEKQQLQMINSYNDLHSQICHAQTIST